MYDRFKFRVFDKETGKYYKSRINKCSGRTLYQHPSSGHCQWVTISTLFAELEQDEKIYTRTGVEPDTIIEQCTGLSDKNGNLIYEGDIIKDKFDNTYLIKWFNAKFICEDQAEMQPIFSPSQELLLNWGVKIISNIHKQAEQKDVK